ncbi:DUF5689 domain-containing protein [Neptunitalea chrysea]|nr:DUF5689 domain-containing protein [Neptunitalea chrysea]
MMKATKFLKLLLPAVVVALTIAACTEDGDYTFPEISLSEPEVDPNIDINLVKQTNNGGVVDFADVVNNYSGESLVFEGYVVSNDEAGNFYKTLVIQDQPENPTAGIQIDIDDASLYEYYKPGQKVYVLLYGAKDNNDNLLPALGMEEQYGVLHIGAIEGTEVARIAATEYLYYIKRSTEVADIVPTVISHSDFDDSMINTLVQLDYMQITSDELGSAYANAGDTYSVNRMLKSCEDNTEVILRNSGYSSFKSQLFPEGQGSIVCVFSKYSSDYQLYIRDTEDIDFTDSRCDPLFEDSFADGALANWTTYSVTGSPEWGYSSYGNSSDSAYISGYSSGYIENEDWLISNAIDLSAVSTATLSFQSAKRYSGNDLELYMSTDYAGGDPNTSGTWTQLSATWDTDTSTWYSWTDSGDIDVSPAAGGTLYIAFKYTSTTSEGAAYEIDNVVIEE